MGKYRKAVAGAVGFALIILSNWFGIGTETELMGIGIDKLVELIIGIGGLVGIWGATNDK